MSVPVRLAALHFMWLERRRTLNALACIEAESLKTGHKKSCELVRRLGFRSRVVAEEEMLETRWDCAPRRGHGNHRNRMAREPLPQRAMSAPAQSGAEPCQSGAEPCAMM